MCIRVICSYACRQAYVHVYLNVLAWMDACMHMHVCVSACIYARMHASLYTRTHAHALAHARTHTNAPTTEANTHTPTLTYTHTGKELFKRCRRPYRPFWVKGASHNNIETEHFQVCMHACMHVDDMYARPLVRTHARMIRMRSVSKAVSTQNLFHIP